MTSKSRSRVALTVVALASLLMITVLVGMAGGRDDGPRSTFSLDQAREFSQFPLYYAGESVDGVPLVAVLRRSDSANYVSFIYGECSASGDMGCAPPGEVQVWPACVRNPARYDRNRSPISPTSVPTSVRGVPAAVFEDGHRLEIQTGAATVVVFGETPSYVTALADALRGVNNPVGPEDGLPMPAAGALEGSLECGA